MRKQIRVRVVSMVLAMAMAWGFATVPAMGEGRDDQAVFDRSMRYLDTGGVLLMLINGADFSAGMLDGIDHLWGLVRQAADQEQALDSPSFVMAEKVFHLVRAMISDSGLPEINAFGMSSKRREEGGFVNRTVLDIATVERPGIAWQLLSPENRPLDSWRVFPPDTVMGYYGGFDLHLLFSWLRDQINQSEFHEAQMGLAMVLEQMRQSGVDLDSLLASGNGDMAWVVTMQPDRRVALPMNGGDFQAPVLEGALLLGVRDDYLFGILDIYLTMMFEGQIERREADGVRWRLLDIDEFYQGQYPLQPVMARFDQYLVVASTQALAEAVVEVSRGRQESLYDTDQFNRLAAGLPRQVSSFTYVSPELMQEYRDFLTMTMADEDPNVRMFMEQWMNLTMGKDSFAVSVGYTTDSGMATAGNSPHSLRQTVLLPVVAVPAVAAGMLMPAVSTARQRAHAVSCASNLRQVGIACIMYAYDHNERLPQSLAAVKEYVGDDSVFTCPVTGHDYLYFGGGYSLRDIESPSRFVLAGDAAPHPDGSLSVLFVDGRVQGVNAPSLSEAARIHGWTIPEPR